MGKKYSFKTFILSILLCTVSLCKVSSQGPSQVGQWGAPIDFDIVPVAVANLPDGRLITWSSRFHDTFTETGIGQTYTQIFDPSTGQPLPRTVSQTDHDMFCPGINNLADGRILSAGGTSSERTSIYDPVTGTWSAADNMNITRGYQGNVTLSDGSVFTIGGSWSDGYANFGGRDAEQWTPETGWFLLPNIKSEILWNANDLSQEDRGIYRVDNHVWLWAAPNGKILHAGPGERMHWIDVANGGSWTDAGQRGNDTYSMKGTTVMFDIGKILKVGGARSYDSNDPAKDNSLVIDINNGDNVTVTATGNNLALSRTMHNSTVLPNGEVLVTGGLDHAQVFTDNGARFLAEIYSPGTNTWRTVAGTAKPRTYHSVGILMADARVFVGGGGLCDATPGCVNHMDAEIYSPPYLFNSNGSPATRPVINTAPSLADWGQTINIGTNSDVSSFSLVRLSSATHSTNNEQRRIPLATPGGTSHTLTMPSRNNAPPGMYMLFAMNANGVPSMAKTIRIGNAVPLGNNPNLVAHYTFDGGSGGTVGDSSGNGNTATIIERDNAGNTVPLSQNYLGGNGIFGSALEMDGSEFNSNSIMDIPYSASLAETQGEITVMAWVYRNENGYNTGLFAHDYNRPGTFFGFHNALYKWEFYTNNGVVTCYAGYVPTNTWVHIVGTFDGSVARLYANGKQISSKTLPQGTLLRHNPSKSFSSSGFYDVGRRISPINGLTDEIDGRIDELKIYKKALSAAEILTEFQTGMASGAQDLIACTPDAIRARYSIDGGPTQSGNNITVAEGQNVVLSADTASATYYITSPSANENTRVTTPPGGRPINVAPGTLTLSNIQASSAGTYVLANIEGCMTTVKITVAGSCDAGDTPIQAEWSTDGGNNYFNAPAGQTANIMADLGDQVRLSILPNGLKFNVTLPDGTVVQNISGDYVMNNVTQAQSGSYYLESSQGCSVIINLMVHLATCDASTIRAEWSLDGGSSYQEAPDNLPVTVSATPGDNVRLSMVPNGINFSIKLPNGNVVNGITTDYVIDTVDTTDSGDYTISSDQGCTTIITLNITFTGTGCSPVQSPWTSADIGAVGATGDACIQDGVFQVSASGADIWGSLDEFHFVYQPMTGDGEIIARIMDIENTNQWAKAGVMMRNSLAPNSAHAGMFVSPNPNSIGGPGYSYQPRLSDGAQMTTQSYTGPNLITTGLPHYVRLVRAGNSFNAYVSETIGNWTQVGSQDIAMGTTIYVGLATTSHNDGTLASANYSEVSVNSGASAPETLAVASATPLSGNAPLVVDFTGSGSTVATGTPSYLWDFKDGFTSTEENPSHTFSSPGDFLVSLTVTDGDDLQDTTELTIAVSPPGSGCAAVPAPWTSADIGAVGATGDACIQDGVFQVSASGADIWGSLDEFHFVYQPMTGDGEIIARIMDIENTNQWAKAGVMMRNSLAPNSAHAGMFVSPNPNSIGGPGYSYQPRLSDGAQMTTQSYTGPNLITTGLPHYVRLVRAGNSFNAYVSETIGNWTQVGSQDIAMGTTIYVGLATTSHNDGTLASANYSEVSVNSGASAPETLAVASATPLSGNAPLVVDFTGSGSTVATGTPSYLWDFKDGFTSTEENPSHTFSSPGDFLVSLTVTDGDDLQDTTELTIAVSPPGSGCAAVPAPWTSADIGAVGATGDACIQDGVFQVSASGADIWGFLDEFHFVYQPMTGDGEIIARIMDIENTNQWAKAGVMMRNSLAPNSAHAGMFVSPNPNSIGGPGYSYQPRLSDGAQMTTQSYTGPNLITTGLPHYVRLVRAGNSFNAYVSETIGNWTQVGSQDIAMGTTIYVGLATTSHNDGTLASANYSEVSVNSGASAPETLAVASATPLSGNAPLVVDFTGSGSTVATGTPSYLWDFKDGFTSTEENPSHTFSSPGDFLVSLTVTDGDDLQDTTELTIAVSPPGSGCAAVPAPWTSADIGAVGATGDACIQDGVFQVSASGADIWGSLDEFHFVYQPMTGDGEIIARIMDIENTNQWAKAGVMMRNSLAPNSAHAGMFVSPNPNSIGGPGYSYQPRLSDGAQMTTQSYTGPNLITTGLPHYVRLVRAGNSFNAYVSETIGNWTQVGSQDIAMGTTIYVGLATTSHNDGTLASANYSEVSVNSGASAPETLAVASATPLSGNAPLVVDFTGSGSTVATGTPSYLWDFKDGFTSTEENPSHTFSSPGDFLVSLTVTDGDDLQDTTELTIAVSPPGSGCAAVPAPWTSADIGAVGATGDACIQDGVFQVSASGADIWGSLDEFHFVYQPMTGDGEIIARIMDIENTNQWAKAGVMMRNSLAPNSAHAGMFVSPNPNSIGGPGYSYQPRLSDGAQMTTQSYTGPNLITTGLPHYVRLVRAGNSFNAYVSETIGNWTQVGSQDIAMGTTIYVGLATTSHNDGTLASANYSEVSVNSTSSTSKSSSLNNITSSNNKIEIKNNQIIAFPNPTSSFVKINIDHIEKRLLNVSIHNFSGELLENKEFSTLNVEYIELDLSIYSDAIYFIKLDFENSEIYTKKIVKKN